MPICPECGNTRFLKKGFNKLRCARCGYELAERGVGGVERS